MHPFVKKVHSKRVPYYFPIYEQRLGSAAVCSLLRTKGFFEPSRLFFYIKQKDNTLTDILSKIGICEEAYCPYIPANEFNLLTQKATTNALTHTFDDKINEVKIEMDAIKSLILYNTPLLATLEIFSSFNDVKDDGMYTPWGYSLGMHDVLCIGYTDTHLEFINSWGESWGSKGRFFLPIKSLGDIKKLLEMGPIKYTTLPKQIPVVIEPQNLLWFPHPIPPPLCEEAELAPVIPDIVVCPPECPSEECTEKTQTAAELKTSIMELQKRLSAMTK